MLSRTAATVLSLVGLLQPVVAHATGASDDAGETDDFDFGEDDPPATRLPSSRPVASARSWSLTGFARSDWGLWAERLEDNPWAKGRQNLDLRFDAKWRWLRVLLVGHAEYDAAYLVQRSNYDAATRREYEWQVNSRELLVALSLGRFELTLGRQIVAWGEGDTLSPLDVVNPRDNREPGLADLDDIRLPVLATRVAWFAGSHRLELMLVHEADFGYRPPPRAAYSPLNQLILDQPLVALAIADKDIDYVAVQPRFAVEQQQLLFRWVYKGPGVDAALYAASVLDQQGLVSIDPAALDADEIGLGLDHRRYTVLGHSGAWPIDAFLFKWELGGELRRPVNVGLPPVLGAAAVDLVNTQVGINWTGIDDLTVAVEWWKSWPLSAPDTILFDLAAPRASVRVSYRLLRQRLLLQLVGLVTGWAVEQGWLARVEATYELRDGLKVTLGYITYQPGDEFGLLFGLSTHDRVFLRLRYDFQLFRG